MHARTLKDDPMGRWSKGEIGQLLENNFDKYDHFVEFAPMYIPPNQRTGFYKNIVYANRKFYFYENEVEIIP